MSYSTGKLYCFSPPVMLATIAIEIGLLVYTFIRFRLNPLTRIVMLQLILLAIFQLAEYSICGRFSVDASTWSRVGYISITMLPPLGLHLIQTISGRGWVWLKWVAYANAVAWNLIFSLSSKPFISNVCGGNYVISQLTHTSGRVYFAYYYFWLLVSICVALAWAYSATKRIRTALTLCVIGYFAFLVPTTVVNNLYPATRSGIPSIMCGFAVIYALILVFGILPLMRKDKKA